MDRKIKTTKDYCELLRACHNIVLTGAPGTGKTYLARQIAAQMVLGKNVDDLEKLEDDEKDILKERTAFVQFHPSYDYTDFVEGLRPVPNTDGSKEIMFERRDGIFKVFCKNAILAKQSSLIDAAYDKFIESIKTGKVNTIQLKTKMSAQLYVTDDDNIKWYSENEAGNISSNAISKPRVKELYKVFNTIKDLETMSNIQQGVKDVIGGCDASYFWGVLHYLLENYVNKANPYVFIIDEINRGVISKIFGELFFSIDPGYRGEKGRANTQYQNLVKIKDANGNNDPFFEGFYVPDNVYIIGTMNDIDRSIESMDFAIRRRFAWVEVKANDNTEMLSKLGDSEAKAKQVMIALNSAIWDDDEKKGIEGLSSAYHIGASYFLKLDHFKESDNPFVDLWNLHLKGLLREYLRGLDDAEEKLDALKKAYNEAAGIYR